MRHCDAVPSQKRSLLVAIVSCQRLCHPQTLVYPIGSSDQRHIVGRFQLPLQAVLDAQPQLPYVLRHRQRAEHLPLRVAQQRFEPWREEDTLEALELAQVEAFAKIRRPRKWVKTRKP
eukprot:TRINITY_DN11488_c0_g1_i1.p5 TRINITY_DN11488_c0_g1~~TRINITY_DN11488_c0_g1_i1.p5  ORF type:complete len:118 (+),score=8.11 TRINITY_DN11488_c0_g1_i1:278-631(+)